MPTAMASLVWTSSLSPYILLVILVGIATSQMLSRLSSDIATQRLLKNWDLWSRSAKPNPGDNLTRRFPQSRRFLFSPTIQNTITNLNHNSNLLETAATDGTEGKQSRSSVKPKSEKLEYDVRGTRPKKICITFE